MEVQAGSLLLSATDLSAFLNCGHLTQLERAAASGELTRPNSWDPMLDVLWERGARHERDYVDHLAEEGGTVVRIDGFAVDAAAVNHTLAAMAEGADIIVQAALAVGSWRGRADVLRRVPVESGLGNWSYEIVDTKLSRQTKGGTLLQLSLYSDMLATLQHRAPEFMHVVKPWTDFVSETYRVADFAAYYRRVKSGLEVATSDSFDGLTYPDPVTHCDICTWRYSCDARRRADDHLSLVAGMTRLQTAELEARGIGTVAALASTPIPLEWKPGRGSAVSFERLREQARLQVEARASGTIGHEFLPPEPGFGLAQLPEPSGADIFLDFEGDSFIGEGGLEYLLGYAWYDNEGVRQYRALWALNREEEKAAFESFVDFAMERWQSHPDLHIYHFGGYERGALTRLMGRYATREEEVDALLRGKVLVDLLTVVRQSVRAGVESYSVKKLEPLYGFQRATGLGDANLALTRFQTCLELDDFDAIEADDCAVIEGYNHDDCLSTAALRIWLEACRDELIGLGHVIMRPGPGEGAPGEAVAAWLERITPLVEQLLLGVAADPAERSAADHGRWLLAQMLDWHRRENKALWWEYFRLSALPAEDLLDEKSGIADLDFIGTVGGTNACPIHRYRFSPQETDIRPEKGLRQTGGAELGKVAAISLDDRTIDIKKRKDTAETHPTAFFMHDYVDPGPMQESLVRLAEYVIANGLEGDGPYAAPRNLLLRSRPLIEGEAPLRYDGEAVLDAGRRIAPLLVAGNLPIQGPPGTGKTFTGAHMICDLVRAGKKVGIVANSHAVIRNLIDAVIEAAEHGGLALRCVQKPAEREDDSARLKIVTKAEDFFHALNGGCRVGGGTAWLWASPAAFQSVDVLFVDEAAQIALANVLAVSQAAPAVVLLGDPQQLDQPMQGSHPEGTDCSALHHLLGGQKTIGAEQGLFLEETWRLHPAICTFTSELFYEDRLTSRPGLELQAISHNALLGGSGLRFVPVAHEGNSNCSPEEAAAIAALVDALLTGSASWTDRSGANHDLTLDDILIITPYNAQIFEIQRHLPQARVGTVDKFQGQEAPLALYSLASSSPGDAPRGMDFLYSLNRLNVATSRARCVSVLIGSPKLFEVECRTPRQMQLANAFCRYLEMAGIAPAS